MSENPTPALPSLSTLLGHSNAAGFASKALHESSSALMVLARTIEETPECEVDQHFTLWADTLRFLGRALHYEGMQLDGWLKPKGDLPAVRVGAPP